jgi:hypothetical protein
VVAVVDREVEATEVHAQVSTEFENKIGNMHVLVPACLPVPERLLQTIIKTAPNHIDENSRRDCLQGFIPIYD